MYSSHHVSSQVFDFHIESQVIYFLSSQAGSHLSSESTSLAIWVDVCNPPKTPSGVVFETCFKLL